MARVGRSGAYIFSVGENFEDLVVKCVGNIKIEVSWKGLWAGFMWFMMRKNGRFL
jgi:hypothetical protein